MRTFIRSLVIVASVGPLLAACGSIVVPAEEADASDAQGGGQGDGQVSGGDGDAAADAGCTTHADCPAPDACREGRCQDGTCVLLVGEPSASAGGCWIDGACLAAGAAEDGDACRVCDPARSTTGWSALTCDDGNPCTADACDATAGCTTSADDGATCDDGKACSEDDHCAGGACVGTCACEVDADCAGEVELGACERARCGASFVCEAFADPALDGTACDDGDACTMADACDGGACAGEPVVCGGGSDCATAACVEGACVVTPLEGAPCVSADPCVLDEACTALGTCAGSWDAGNPACQCEDDSFCNDGLPCTLDACDTAAGSCSNSLLPGFCLIAGVCWIDGQANPDNPCGLCEADVAQATWSTLPCDDGDACTSDSCAPGSGCKHAPLTGTPCTDEDPCTKNEACDAGVCVGECECKVASHCQPGDYPEGIPPCQKPACIGFACELEPVADGEACDDGDPCSLGDTCQTGACTAGEPVVCPPPGGCAAAACDPVTGACGISPAASGTACTDGDPCTLGDACDGTGLCSGTPKDCSSFDTACAVGVCDAGTCFGEVQVGAPCDDGQACTEGDACGPSGTCAGTWNPALAGCGCQTDADCDDGLACTLDACSPATKSCVYTAKGGQCWIDGACYAAGAVSPTNACKVCKPSVAATAWQSVVCSDGNPCTDDTCAPASGCAAVNDDTNGCSDGDACTVDDRCEDGACVATRECTVDADCTGTPGQCLRFACQGCACVAVPDAAQNGAACDDGKYCTVGDQCLGGTCQAGLPRNCSGAATGACTKGVCDEATDACVPALLPDGTSCSDGNPCTKSDACDEGLCLGQPLDCSSLDGPCVVGACVGGSCQGQVQAGAPCDDGEPCTLADACGGGGQCAGTWSTAVAGCECASDDDCAPQFAADPCFEGRCDPATNGCYGEPQIQAPCDDEDPCTADDACGEDGTCQGVAFSCDDGLDCTTDACGGTLDACTSTLSASSCEIDGVCYAAGAANPANPCARCEGGHAWTPLTGDACDDGDPCTKDDACTAGTCSGTAYDCPVDAECQAATCDGAGGCSVVLLAGWCRIEGQCIPAGTVHPTNPCLSCQPAKASTTWSARSASCDDGDPCTKADTCTAGTCAGAPYSCDDGQACTADACNAGDDGCSHTLLPAWCFVDGVCYADGAGRPGEPCQACKASASGEAWTPVAQGTPCNDGLACTDDDACNAEGLCEGSVGSACVALSCQTAACAPAGGCEVTLKAGWCLIDGQCRADGVGHPTNPCLACDAAADPGAWSPTTTACDDGNPCTKGDACDGGVCAGVPYTCGSPSDPACLGFTCDGAGGCEPHVAADTCLIDGTCFDDGATNPAQSCEHCVADGSDPTGWSPRSDGVACADDGLKCTLDACASGICVHFVAPVGATSCAIDGACYADGQPNPVNGCEVCDAAQSTTQWSPVEVGAACADDGSVCTVDACDGGGTCIHAPLPDFNECGMVVDQVAGKEFKEFGLCSSGECIYWDRWVSSQGDELVATRAAPSFKGKAPSTGIHVATEWKDGKAILEKAGFVEDGAALALGSVELIDFSFGYQFLPAPRYAVFDYGQTAASLFTWDKDPGRAWYAGDTSAQVKSWATLEDATPGHFKGIGWASDEPETNWSWASWGTRNADNYCIVRSCDAYCNSSSPLTERACQATSACGRRARGWARIGGTEYLAAHSCVASDTELPDNLAILEDDGGSFTWLASRNVKAGSDGRTIEAFRAVGNVGLAAGRKGLLFVFYPDTDSVSVVSGVFASQPLTDFRAITTYQGRVFVVGVRTTLSESDPKLVSRQRDFVMAHAPVGANLSDPKAWTAQAIQRSYYYHDEYVVPAATVANCQHPEDHVDLRGMVTSGGHLYLVGSWCASPTEPTGVQRAAVWRWTPAP